MKLHDFANLFTAYKKKMTLEMNVTKVAPCEKLFCCLKKFFLLWNVGCSNAYLKVKNQNLEIKMWGYLKKSWGSGRWAEFRKKKIKVNESDIRMAYIGQEFSQSLKYW